MPTQRRLGHIVLLSYCLSLVVSLSSYHTTRLYLGQDASLPNLIWLQLLSYLLTLLSLNRRYSNRPTYQICARAHFLGYVLSFGFIIHSTMFLPLRLFGAYAALLSLFHLTEFLAIAYTNPAQASVDTFVINHSPAYTYAALLSWAEFVLECLITPELKSFGWVTYAGVALCCGGELLRKLAIFTAGKNFNHVVQSERKKDHKLVKHGVYGLCRHPSYVGWFYWSVGTQLVLQNPVCAVVYAVAAWRFFKERIILEEMTLCLFFGKDYEEYRKRVGTGLPFIEGYERK